MGKLSFRGICTKCAVTTLYRRLHMTFIKTFFLFTAVFVSICDIILNRFHYRIWILVQVIAQNTALAEALFNRTTKKTVWILKIIHVLIFIFQRIATNVSSFNCKL